MPKSLPKRAQAVEAPTKHAVIVAAQKACKSLSQCANFFNFETTDSWLGWENWLTIDIVRRLDHKRVIRFGQYPTKSTRTDILINGSTPIFVEVKVNYADKAEIKRWNDKRFHNLPERVVKDLRKLDRHGKSAVRLMLVAIAFDKKSHQTDYRELVKKHLKAEFSKWKIEWENAGSISLLAMSKNPARHKK